MIETKKEHELIYKEESYSIVGACFEVHKTFGKGFSENIYKDAIEYEFQKRNIPYSREKEFEVKYKDTILKHKFFADFIVYNKIILEVKCAENIIDGFKLGIIANFGEDSLTYKRGSIIKNKSQNQLLSN